MSPFPTSPGQREHSRAGGCKGTPAPGAGPRGSLSPRDRGTAGVGGYPEDRLLILLIPLILC